jgi:cobalt/nickel transport system permease protein
MHIVDGALSPAVALAGGVLSAGGIAVGLRQMTLEKIPAAGMLSATFFVASLVHVPIGPSSVHLIMNGLAGLILGWSAFPALFIGLLLQAVFFGFGGLTALGVNTFNIALPAVIVGLICRHGVCTASPRLAMAWGALAGAGAIALTTIFVGLALWITGEAFIPAAKLVFVAHLPIMLIEGLVCAAAASLIRRVQPGLFGTLTTASANGALQ